MRYALAMLPILVVLVLMIWRGWGAHKAGAVGWLAGLVVGATWFGATPELFWVSQAKGLLLSTFVLAVMWPALLLYHWIDQNEGIKAVARALEQAITNRGMCLVLLAWAVSGLLEGVAGFGLPIAVVAPMLVALKVTPVRAVTAVAVGHSWSVTFGDMGVILQTLSAVVGIPVPELVGAAGVLLGVACLLCGVLAAIILGEAAQWLKVAGLSVVMALVQYGFAAAGLASLSAFSAGLAGMMVYMLCAWLWRRSDSKSGTILSERTGAEAAPAFAFNTPPARVAIACYGGLTLLMATLTLVPWLRAQALGIEWRANFQEVTSGRGFSTPAGPGQIFRPLAHPGALILVVALASMAAVGTKGMARAREAAAATVRSAGWASIGILFMVGISTLMDHCGMSYALAQGLTRAMGAAYPIVSPCVGILGAFATGSNNNSNVLFGSLQKNVAVLLKVDPTLLVAAQTAGGSLGSMLAPAKIVVGCSTVGQGDREGQVLRKTVPCGLAAGLALGALTLALTHLR